MLHVVCLCAAMAAASSGTPDDLSAFREWYTSLHDTNGKIDVRDTPSWGRGVYATRDIKIDETILRIPQQWLVSHDSITRAAKDRKAHSKDAAREYALYSSLDNQNDALIAWLLVEHVHKRTDSAWHVWLRMLPQIFSVPLLFGKEETALVEPLRVREDVRSMQSEAATKHKELQKKLWFDVTLDEWKWAKSVLSTRAWHMQGVETLVPVAGMFNHMPDADDAKFDYTRATGRSQKFLRYHKISSGTAQVRADRSVAAGEQVFESYGDNPSWIYFVHHGFVPEHNVYDCYKLMLTDPSQLPFALPEGVQAFPLTDKRLELLRRANVARTMCLHKDEVSRVLQFFLGVATVRENRLQKCMRDKGVKDITPNKKSYRSFFKCTKNKDTATRLMVKLLNYELATQFRSTDADDEAALASLPEGHSGARAAIAYRREQRALLKSVAVQAEALLPEHRRTADLSHDHSDEL